MYKGYFVSLKYVPARAVMMFNGYSHPKGGPLVTHSAKVILTLDVDGVHKEFNIYRDLLIVTDKDHIFRKFVSKLAQKLEGQVFDISSKMKVTNFNEVVRKCL